MPEFDLIESLFFIRHAEYDFKTSSGRILSPIGRITLIPTIRFIREKVGSSPYELGFVSSTCSDVREGIKHIAETMFGTGKIIDFPALRCLQFPDSPMQIYDELNATLANMPEKNHVIMGHAETIGMFPQYFAKRRGIEEIPLNFAVGYGAGTYVNLRTGKWEKIRG